MKSLIIGTGEIGTGLYKCLKDVHDTDTYDLSDDIEMGTNTFPTDDDYEVLHICIPGNINGFKKTVIRYINRVKPTLTIIHSTVEVGTTRTINTNIKYGEVVHSPVRGIHPHMEKGIKTYVKYVGYISLDARDYALKYFKDTEIKIKTLYKPETTELAKILSTTRYGINLMFARLTRLLCEKTGLNAREVYQELEITYNAGLKEIGMDKYCRPILELPGEKIGGHCVIENAYMLLNQLYPDKEADTTLASVLSDIVQTGKGDRKLEGF